MKKRSGIVCAALICAMGMVACGDADSGKNTSRDQEERNTSQDPEESTDEEKDSAAEDKDKEEPDKSADADVKENDTEAGPQIAPDSTDNELGWDGEWTGGGVTVKINGAGEDWVTVDFVDEEMHSSLDEVSIEGNVLTGVYMITLDAYPDPDADVPEQEWTITMVKDGAHASYSRTAVLTWFSPNEDGTYGREIVKENSASLTLVTNSVTTK